MKAWKMKSNTDEIEYKKTACTRERMRMRDMNVAYESLRRILPTWSQHGKKMPKIEALRTAIDYIKKLQAMLNDEEESPEVELTSPVPRSSHYSSGIYVPNDCPIYD